MPMQTPPNSTNVRQLVEQRVDALKSAGGHQETVTIEWRGRPLPIPVITMPVSVLHYNPDTHRIRAQKSTDLNKEKSLLEDPFGEVGQAYLHQLLMGDPKDPSKIDPSFVALREDLSEHGQSEPGIITRAGVLINGNTRQAALKQINQENIRVGVLPPDAGHDDLQSVELSLQLRKDHKRDYSFMNSLLAIDERTLCGHAPAKIQSDFRIKQPTFEQRRWILEFVRDAIERSQQNGPGGKVIALRLVDFESHQGKLEELYRAYTALKLSSSDQAEALKEQRLLALILDKSKTDLRLIEPDFMRRYMKNVFPDVSPTAPSTRTIPGTSISVPGPSQEVETIRQLTTDVLRAKSISISPEIATPTEMRSSSELLQKIDESLVRALDHAGKQGRVMKRRLAPIDRITDACDDLELAVGSIAEARATANFDPSDLDEVLLTLKANLTKLSAIIIRGTESDSEGISWMRMLCQMEVPTT